MVLVQIKAPEPNIKGASKYENATSEENLEITRHEKPNHGRKKTST